MVTSLHNRNCGGRGGESAWVDVGVGVGKCVGGVGGDKGRGMREGVGKCVGV